VRNKERRAATPVVARTKCVGDPRVARRR